MFRQDSLTTVQFKLSFLQILLKNIRKLLRAFIMINCVSKRVLKFSHDFIRFISQHSFWFDLWLQIFCDLLEIFCCFFVTVVWNVICFLNMKAKFSDFMQKWIFDIFNDCNTIEFCVDFIVGFFECFLEFSWKIK